MKIESEVARLSRYGDDALEGFYTAVDNGQARLAMTILVDVISAFANKIDALEESLSGEEKEILPPAKEVKEPVVEKEEDTIKPEVVKSEQKAKSTAKEASSKEEVSE